MLLVKFRKVLKKDLHDVFLLLNQLKKGVTPNEDKSIRPHRLCGISR